MSEKTKQLLDLPKVKNFSDPRQRLAIMIYVAKKLRAATKREPAQPANDGRSVGDQERDRLVRRVIASFAKVEKKAFSAFSLDASRKVDKEILLACLSWVLFGKAAKRGRPRTEDKILESVQQKIAPLLAKDPNFSNTALGRLLGRNSDERRTSDTLRKLASKARARSSK
ncbi:hypothetical protein [Bradyrhizobium sp. USDA 3650]